MSTGIGGDVFAASGTAARSHALDAAGPAPAVRRPAAPVEQRGPRSTTVPGSVAGWAALLSGSAGSGSTRASRDAIDIAESRRARVGHAAGARCGQRAAALPRRLGQVAARRRDRTGCPLLGRDARAGSPRTARTRCTAARSPRRSRRRRWLEESDLAAYAPRWVEPLSVDYRGIEVSSSRRRPRASPRSRRSGILAARGADAGERGARRPARARGRASPTCATAPTSAGCIEPEYLAARAARGRAERHASR